MGAARGLYKSGGSADDDAIGVDSVRVRCRSYNGCFSSRSPIESEGFTICKSLLNKRLQSLLRILAQPDELGGTLPYATASRRWHGRGTMCGGDISGRNRNICGTRHGKGPSEGGRLMLGRGTAADNIALFAGVCPASIPYPETTSHHPTRSWRP